ncbi:DNA polymerase epsilon subunit C-like [Quillaja saponaria]|uniref:DNA polymerase epsilon subunit C-like n=1 Tax=Quillaja saponaria TaxID=32244 RepID=A0AAD7KXN4_QUISA|nr:DNA polymerase epsilon subunit C-like [Quillaja saponaria]KAJ7947794.1 DNA polymerase epsilon subunit C-like [Quillaja saponaria]
MASSKNFKAEKKPKDAESTKKLSKPSSERKEEKKMINNKTSNSNVIDNEILIVPSSSTESQEDEEDEEAEEVEENEDVKALRIPMNRIKMIITAGDYGSRFSNEAIFVINKATEKFLEQFTQDAYAYACSVHDRKESLAHKHLSSVVGKLRRYEFLLDFVPDKLKAEDALKERNSVGPGAG